MVGFRVGSLAEASTQRLERACRRPAAALPEAQTWAFPQGPPEVHDCARCARAVGTRRVERAAVRPLCSHPGRQSAHEARSRAWKLERQQAGGAAARHACAVGLDRARSYRRLIIKQHGGPQGAQQLWQPCPGRKHAGWSKQATKGMWLKRAHRRRCPTPCWSRLQEHVCKSELAAW